MASTPARFRIVILGGGAGGLELAAGLADRSDLSVTLVDQVSTHIWKPRLHEFAAGTVNSTLAEMSFYMLAPMRGFRFEQGRVEAIDRHLKTVRLAGIIGEKGEEIACARDISFDLCVVALGGVTPDFGTKGVDEFAVRLDRKVDAQAFRDRFIACMIAARESGEPASIAIIGSGATGTELAAHLRRAEQAFFEQNNRDREVRFLDIRLLEAAPELMPGSDADLRRNVQNRLDALHIAVETNAEIEAVTQNEVRSATGQVWKSDITVWAAGLVGHPCLKSLGDFEMDRHGRIVVDERLRSSIDPAILVLGDAASLTPPGREKPLPPTAQCASQQAAYLAKAIPRMVAGDPVDAFVYNDKGQLLSLASAGSVGLFGFARQKNDLLIHGRFATAAYHALQRQHQWAVLGPVRGSIGILADAVSPTGGPALKLHG